MHASCMHGCSNVLQIGRKWNEMIIDVESGDKMKEAANVFFVGNKLMHLLLNATPHRHLKCAHFPIKLWQKKLCYLNEYGTVQIEPFLI